MPDASETTVVRRAAWAARAVLAALVALPLAGALRATSVGSFRMFTAPVAYDVQVAVIESGGVRYLPSRALAPHLSPDAARVLLAPRERAYAEAHVELIEGGMGDLGALACALAPEAESAVVVLRHGPHAERMTSVEIERPCAR